MNISSKPPLTLTAREFNQDTAGAKRLARNGPVFITDRGKPSHVLLSFEEYERLEALHQADGPSQVKSLRESVMDPQGDEFDFEPPRLSEDWGLRIPKFD